MVCRQSAGKSVSLRAVLGTVGRLLLDESPSRDFRTSPHRTYGCKIDGRGALDFVLICVPHTVAALSVSSPHLVVLVQEPCEQRS